MILLKFKKKRDIFHKNIKNDRLQKKYKQGGSK